MTVITGIAPITNNTASFTTTAPIPGNYTGTVSYDPVNYGTLNIFVDQAQTTTTLIATPSTTTVCTFVTLTAIIAPTYNLTGSVTFFITDPNGNTTNIQVPVAFYIVQTQFMAKIIGTYNIYAVYSGNVFNSFSTSNKVAIKINYSYKYY